MYKQLKGLPIIWLTIPLSLFVLNGCQNNPSKIEENFGSSVRNAIALQTAQPGEVTPSMDGQKGEVVMETYRKDVAKPETVERDLIQINLGK